MLKRIVGTLSIAGVCALMSLPTAAYADDETYLNEATQALQSTDIYVAPGVSGVGADAVTTLQQQIGDNDIVIVVLPASASSDITDLPSFTTQIAQRSGHETVLVALGDDFASVSSALPSGTAQSLADQAESSGGSYTDELVNFVNNVNSTEASIEATENPGPDVGGMVLGGIGVVFGVALLTALVVIGIRYLPTILRQRRLNAVPKSQSSDLIRELLEDIGEYRGQVKDSNVRSLLEKLAADTDRLFIRLKEGKSDRFHEITARYESMLQYVRGVVRQYLNIQKYPEDYDQYENPLERMTFGITKYNEAVKQNIKEVTTGQLTEFDTSIQMLEANAPKPLESRFLERG